LLIAYFGKGLSAYDDSFWSVKALP